MLLARRAIILAAMVMPVRLAVRMAVASMRGGMRVFRGHDVRCAVIATGLAGPALVATPEYRRNLRRCVLQHPLSQRGRLGHTTAQAHYVLILRKLSRSFREGAREHRVLDNVDITVAQGE